MTNIIRATKDGVTKDFNSLEDAKKLAKKGYNLVLTARRTELLENLANEIKQ